MSALESVTREDHDRAALAPLAFLKVSPSNFWNLQPAQGYPPSPHRARIARLATPFEACREATDYIPATPQVPPCPRDAATGTHDGLRSSSTLWLGRAFRARRVLT